MKNIPVTRAQASSKEYKNVEINIEVNIFLVGWNYKQSNST